MNSKVNFYFENEERWQYEITELRKVVLSTGLNEELKWGCPCYTLGEKNVVLIHVFKDYCALLFFKGALMKDPRNILIQQSKNVQAARQIRFTGVKDIVRMKAVIRSYIKNAIEIEKSGLKVPLKKVSEFKMPAEFREMLSEMPELKTAFKGLTPGRQRAYILHFSQPKQSVIRQARIEKNIKRILAGKGLND